MSKKCIYCKTEIPNESVIDFCEGCGLKVWGKKMFEAILHNMEDAREKGDLSRMNNVSEIGGVNGFSSKRF